MTILEEARNSLIVIVHDPILYKNPQGMVEYVSRGLHESQADPRGDLPRQALGRVGDDQMRLEEKNWSKESWQSGGINSEANSISSAHHF
jgi:hypothetical protein